MSIIATKGDGKDFAICPAGTVQAVCNDVWDIGKQRIVWQGKEKIQHKVIISWEVNELIPEGDYQGKRFCVSKRYTLSLHEKSTLTGDIENWRGQALTDEEKEGFDLEGLVGMNCMLGIVHNTYDGKTYANVGSISKLMKGLPPMTPENERKIPTWIAKLIEKGKAEVNDVIDGIGTVPDESGIPF